MTQKLILVELPERIKCPYQHKKKGVNCSFCKEEKIHNDCLDTLKQNSVRVDVGKLAELLRHMGADSYLGISKKIINAIESGELWEEGK